MTDHACPPDAHTHPYTGLVFIQPGGAFVAIEGRVLVTAHAALAERVADLLRRHGLADAPDTLAELTPWPAPTDPPTVIAKWQFPTFGTSPEETR